ncbi:MAG: hypothetical protein GW939_00175 [Candidatus Magasanikbacteria bacterium]|uniref:Uncharacterized protein n=1 Tax=Candidatus Magasanikbacteria bacterium CG10_big_fil_rev_8_21_14_0_10_38_6 TaxID=1974647 RepID=A0A2M6P2F1_9BACT|nr:hypothetical protein [Candidatus Magasanikbacteria bacterium]NCS72406.1 hypothetical protein [Candidatus Magasanikbacteria bacterium]PIR77864.1 MAG: hypothetical protein COU30_00135 [Candidatus Magasanikbacteria bacterium CG10_big_fil_rev_8_21_14_0_10_38_6]
MFDIHTQPSASPNIQQIHALHEKLLALETEMKLLNKEALTLIDTMKQKEILKNIIRLDN